jgi:predicted RNA binding protein YcfA (HicA-like mRNA interferase family)
MSRIAKLYRKLIEGRPLTFAEFEKLLRAFGYVRIDQRGSHISWRHPQTGDKRIIQPNGKDAKRYQVGQFLDMIEKYALTLDDDDDAPLSH